jgi:uncharacterized protein (DUF934 family)
MLIKANGAPPHIADDEFAFVADDVALPPDGAIIVSLKRFLADKDALLGRAMPLGVQIETADSPEALGGDVHKLAVIVLHVPYFKDGRHFSRARLLRTRLGYTGEIRVSGHVLRDQLAFYARVGVDAFDLTQNIGPADIDAALHEIGVVYQPSVDGRMTVRELRAKQTRNPS